MRDQSASEASGAAKFWAFRLNTLKTTQQKVVASATIPRSKNPDIIDSNAASKMANP
jgi:hypothetical protein